MRTVLAACFLAVLPAAAPAAPPLPPPKLTLAQALRALPPPKDGVWLAVGADKTALPDGLAPPPADSSAGGIAAAFGGITQEFGGVTAIAPAAMTVLNTQPAPPDPAKDLTPRSALDQLTASLDDSQWHALTSEHGLGLADLTGNAQQEMFHSLFNHGHLWISSEDPALSGLPPEKRADVRDETGEIDATRIRLGQTASFYLHDRRGKTLYFSEGRPDAASRLHTYRPKMPLPSAEQAVTLAAAFPNMLKPADLDWDGKALQAPVPLAGLQTVGDLVSRAAQKTGLELYADPHYAAKALTVAGKRDAPAADLLRAVCLCVTGTFRRVGPAYVLTDDLAGVGVRRKRLAEWEEQAMNDSSFRSREAGEVMLKRHGADARRLPTFGDPLAATAEQIALMPDAPGLPGIPTMNEVAFPFDKLTPAQKAWARQTAAAYNEQRHTGKLPGYLDGDDLDDADLTHTVNFNVEYQLQFLVPSAGAPVNTNLNSELWMLFYTGDTPEARRDYALLEAKEKAALPPAPPLSAALRSGRVRGVVGQPRTAAGVDALLSAMGKLGLNALFLEVYSNGVSRLSAGRQEPDILTEALTKTRGTGVAVYAVCSLLSWGGESPEAVRDLTIDGKTTREEWQKPPSVASQDGEAGADSSVPSAAPPLRVSPAAPEVRDALSSCISALAARPGLAGFVWEDGDNPGNLGYTPAARLAFLRSAHADPVDVTVSAMFRADASLPLFDEDAVDGALKDKWTRAVTGTYADLLRHLYAAAQRSGGSTMILMDQQEPFGDNWLASWDNPRTTPPVMRDLVPNSSFPTEEKILRLTRGQSRLVLKREGVRNDGETDVLARQLSDDAKTLPSDGFVLEFDRDEVTQGKAPLDSLVRAVSAEKAVK